MEKSIAVELIKGMAKSLKSNPNQFNINIISGTIIGAVNPTGIAVGGGTGQQTSVSVGGDNKQKIVIEVGDLLEQIAEELGKDSPDRNTISSIIKSLIGKTPDVLIGVLTGILTQVGLSGLGI